MGIAGTGFSPFAAIPVALAVAVVALPGARAEAHVSRLLPASGTIAYLRQGRLYLMNADGTGQRRRTPADGFPAWSPDGRMLAVSGPTRIYVTDANGIWRHALSEAAGYPQCLWFTWSPDSRRIAYTHNRDCGGPFHMFVVNADGSGRRELTRARDRDGSQPFFDTDPAWSPDGQNMAFLHHEQGSTLVVMSVDGSRRRTVRRAHPGYIGGAASRPPVVWSPDGKRIFFIAERALAVLTRASGRIRWLAEPPKSFALSPDGRQIAYQVSDGRDWEIHAVNSDGTGRRALTDNRRVQDTDPQWSPDSRTILFVREPFDGNADFYAMNADGTRKRNLTRSAADEKAPAWSPEH